MNASRGSATRRGRGAERLARRLAAYGVTIASVAVAVSPLGAQPTGTPLAAPVVHELRATVPALSRATLNTPSLAGDGSWLSSIDAVTNVAIDVLLLAPADGDPMARSVQIRDADGVLRRWSDGPILVARALRPGRHRVALRGEGSTLSDGDLARVAAVMRTATRTAESVPVR
jgi:hypothetical protein